MPGEKKRRHGEESSSKAGESSKSKENKKECGQKDNESKSKKGESSKSKDNEFKPKRKRSESSKSSDSKDCEPKKNEPRNNRGESSKSKDRKDCEPKSKRGKSAKSKVTKECEPICNEPERLMSPEKVKNMNVVNFLKESQRGNISSAIADQIKQWAVIKQVSEFTALQEVYDSRITAICWHHSLALQNVVAVGIKNGYICVKKVCPIKKEIQNMVEFEEIGKGNAIYSMKFDPTVDECLYAACWDGTVTAKNIETNLSTQILTKTRVNQWFTTLDVSNDGEFLVSGCTMGRLHIFTRDGKLLFDKIIHPQRVLSVHLCPRDKNLIATGSLDRTVKLWDRRYIKDIKSYTMELKHNSPPSIAAFSNSGCNQLLTSDQFKEIRVYSAGNWKLLNTIEHHHKHYMYLTPIKASWHPTSDIIVIGNHPIKNSENYVENEPRTIDFYCSNTGKTLYQLLKPGVSNLISSINVFNSTGNMLASGRGGVLVLWSKYYSDINRGY